MAFGSPFSNNPSSNMECDGSKAGGNVSNFVGDDSKSIKGSGRGLEDGMATSGFMLRVWVRGSCSNTDGDVSELISDDGIGKNSEEGVAEAAVSVPSTEAEGSTISKETTSNAGPT